MLSNETTAADDPTKKPQSYLDERPTIAVTAIALASVPQNGQNKRIDETTLNGNNVNACCK